MTMRPPSAKRIGMKSALRPAAIDLAAIKPRALGGVGDNVVGGGDFLELLLDILAPRIDVRVQFLRQLAISRLDFIRACGPWDTEDLIGIRHNQGVIFQLPSGCWQSLV